MTAVQIVFAITLAVLMCAPIVCGVITVSIKNYFRYKMAFVTAQRQTMKKISELLNQEDEA